MNVLQIKIDVSKTAMKVKQRVNHHVIILCAIALLGLNVSTVAMASNELDAGEIKKVRHISRALLQSRALEKKRIEAEVVVQRADIKKMEDSVGELISSVEFPFLKADITSQESSSVTTTNKIVVDNEISAVLNPNGTVTQNKAQQVVVQPVIQSLEVKADAVQIKAQRIAQDRINKVAKSKRIIGKVRVTTESDLPSSFAFWKEKSKRDVRNEKIISTAESVEQELNQMMNEEKFDLQKLRALKKKLSLKKHSIKAENSQPSIQTRTRHRVQ